MEGWLQGSHFVSSPRILSANDNDPYCSILCPSAHLVAPARPRRSLADARAVHPQTLRGTPRGKRATSAFLAQPIW